MQTTPRNTRARNSEQLPNRRRNGSHPNQPHNRQNSPLDDRRLSRPPQNDRVCFTSNILILPAQKPCFCAICLVCSHYFSRADISIYTLGLSVRLRSTRQAPRPCDRPANSHQGDPNSLSSLSRAGSMVIQQDNTRPSTSLNTFIDKASPETTSQSARVERLVPLQTHTAATHISTDNKYSPAIKTAKSTKTRRMLSSDSPAKTTKTSINIAFLSPFHVKHRLKSHISTPLNPSALLHDRRHQTTKHIEQCKHASIALPRSILRRFTYSAPLSL